MLVGVVDFALRPFETGWSTSDTSIATSSDSSCESPFGRAVDFLEAGLRADAAFEVDFSCL